MVLVGGTDMVSRKAIYCNACGKEIKMYNNMLVEDIFEGKKEWGYFSKHDLKVDTFYLCEKCYEDMIAKFKIPISRMDKVEAL